MNGLLRQEDCNRAQWRAKKEAFPHHMASDLGEPSPVHVKEVYGPVMDGHFICYPFDGQAHWGFEKESDRAAILAIFPKARRLGL